MSGTKTFLVKYYLGEGIVAEELVNALNPKEAYSNYAPGTSIRLTGREDAFYVFNSNDIKMVSVHEQKE